MDLKKKLKREHFRERSILPPFNVFSIELAPSAVPDGGCPCFAGHFLSLRLLQGENKGRPVIMWRSFAAGATTINIPRPGNIRELRNVIERAAL